jgi:hypothetical protein
LVTSSFGLAADAAKSARLNRRDEFRLDGLSARARPDELRLTHERKLG